MSMSSYKIKIIGMLLLAICLVLIYQKTTKPSGDALYYTKQGDKYYSEKKYNLAIETYKKALNMGLEAKSIFFTLGLIYYQEKQDYKKAEEAFKRGLRLAPQDDWLHFFLSKLYFDMKELDKGLAEYKLYAKYSKYRKFTLGAGRLKEILLELGKSDKEIENFLKKLIKINPNDHSVLGELAKYHQEQREYLKAIEEYEKILALNPNMKMVYREIARCYYNLEEYKLALKYYKKSDESGYSVAEELFKAIKQKIKQKNRQ